MTTARVRQEGDQVLLVIDGQGWIIPPQQAKELAQALLRKASQALETKQIVVASQLPMRN